jgi:hypothetical protein
LPEGANLETRVKEGRTALAITVLLIATLTVPSLIAGGAFSLAQSQQSPSPTGTAPTIELVNPSDYEGTPVLSDKDNNPGNDSSGDDPNDEKYHFNAWTRNAPNNATVEFFIVQGSNQISLGFGQNQGNGVFDLYSGIPDNLSETTNAATAATVRAILYSGGELDRDEQAVTINQVNDEEASEPALMQGERRASRAAETAEITYPVNGGGVGFFGRTGQPKAAHIELRHSRTAAEGLGLEDNAGPENIRVYYTVSHRGTDPDWKECGTDETQAQAADGVRCELLSGDQPEWVTGIAVVTMDAEASPTAPGGQDAENVHNAGDAHVATGYTQNPAAVAITSPTGSTATGCSPLIPVLVSDQIGRKIVGAPVDVHAQGPTDALAFNTEDDEDEPDNDAQPDPHPNDQPENHSTEQGRQCSDGALSEENQGEHEEAGAQPDRKHIESTNGTDATGRFVYQMWSNAPGGTTMTAFVDMDDDDFFCATEVSGNGILTWGTGGPNAPQPGGPDIQTCPATQSGSSSTGTASRTSGSTSPSSTTPTNTASQTTTSPTSTASRSTGSPTSTASQSTGSPTGTGTTSGTGGTTATTPQRATVEVTLETSQARKTFGKSFTLSGSVSSDNAACTDLVDVQILRDVLGGDEEFELFAQETTDTNGAYSMTDRADRSANYIAQVSESSACEDATSEPQPVLVRTKVTLILSRTKVPEGGRVRFTIKTAPCPATARDRVLLFRAIDGEFGKAAGKRNNQRCVAKIGRRINESSVFQARWPKQRPDLLAARSRSKAVRVTN